MKVNGIALCLAGCVVVAPAVANQDDMFVGDYRAAKRALATKQYVATAGVALESANYRLSKRPGNQELYCPPEKMRLVTENYIAVLENELLKSSRPGLPLASVTDVLLDGLIRTFPCKAQ